MSEAVRIEHDLMDEPHVAGRRIGVLQLYDLVEKKEMTPQAVADRFGLDVADVYHALAYYHDHPSEMKGIREERQRALESIRERVSPPE